MSNFLLLGDFNAGHASWGDKSNAQGEILNDFLQQKELIALNDGEPTFTCTNGKSVIDLVLGNANLHRFSCGLAIDYYTEMYTGAQSRGHYPGIATFDIAGNSRSTHVKDLKKTDREKWKETLENCVQSRWPEIDECFDATCLWGILLQCICEAANLTIPLKQITSHSKPFFNEELKMLSLQLRNASPHKIRQIRMANLPK